MDRLYQTTGSNNPYQLDQKTIEQMNNKNKQMFGFSRPESTDHQSSSSIQLTDSRYTFQKKFKTNTLQTQRETINLEQNKHESIEIQRNKLIIVRQLGQLMGVSNISLNDLKSKIKAMISDNQKLKQRSSSSINEDLHRSITSVNSQRLSRRTQQAQKALQNKNDVMSLAVKNLNQSVDRHRKQIEQIFDRLPSNEGQSRTKNMTGILFKIQKLKQTINGLTQTNTQLQNQNYNQSSRIRQYQSMYQNLLQQNNTIKQQNHKFQTSQPQKITVIPQQITYQLSTLKQNQQKYKQRINHLQQYIQQLNSRSRGSQYLSQDTPNFKQQQKDVKDLNLSLLRHKEQQNKQLILTIEELNLKIQQASNRMIQSTSSTKSNTTLMNYCKQLQQEILVLKSQKQLKDISIQNSRISVESKGSKESLKNKYEEVSSINNKLQEQNMSLLGQVNQLSDQMQKQASKIQQLNSITSNMSNLERNLSLKSDQLQTTTKLLVSKQQQIDLYQKLIEQKNNQIIGLRSELQHFTSMSVLETNQSDNFKKQIKLLQQSLKQSIETHQRYVTMTTEQVDTLQKIGIDLEKQNSDLLNMIKQYEQQIDKLIKNGNIRERPQSLKSQAQNQQYNTRASIIKKQLDKIVASIENKKSLQNSRPPEEIVIVRKDSSTFKNPFDVSRSNSIVNLSPVRHVKSEVVNKVFVQPNISHPSNKNFATNQIYSKSIKQLPQPFINDIPIKTFVSAAQLQQVSHKTPPKLSPITKVVNNSPSSRIIIMDRRQSTSRQKSLKQIDLSNFTTTTVSHTPKSNVNISKTMTIQQQSPKSTITSMTKINPIQPIIIDRSQQIKTSPYFQYRITNPIPQVMMQTSSKVSSRMQKSISNTSKPSTTPASIYNIQGYKTPKQSMLVIQDSSQQQGIKMIQLQQAPRSDCC